MATIVRSQNRWPALGSSSRLLHVWIIPCRTGTIRLKLRNGSAGFLLAHFVLWYGDSIEKLQGKVLDDWGYADRLIRGSLTEISNHSSGTAADLNATKHPLGTLTLKPWQKAKIRARLLIYSGCIRAGLDYHRRKDEQHYEINKDIAACERVAKRLLKSDRGVRLLDANPSQRPVILS